MAYDTNSHNIEEHKCRLSTLAHVMAFRNIVDKQHNLGQHRLNQLRAFVNGSAKSPDLRVEAVHGFE